MLARHHHEPRQPDARTLRLPITSDNRSRPDFTVSVRLAYDVPRDRHPSSEPNISLQPGHPLDTAGARDEPPTPTRCIPQTTWISESLYPIYIQRRTQSRQTHPSSRPRYLVYFLLIVKVNLAAVFLAQVSLRLRQPCTNHGLRTSGHTSYDEGERGVILTSELSTAVPFVVSSAFRASHPI